jgi:hypothetical protein
VGRQLLDIEYAQSRGRHHAFGAEERKIEKVLVIDGVELHLLDQIQQVRKFERGDALGRKQFGEPGDKVSRRRRMGEHIVGDHQIRLAAGGSEALGGRDAEEGGFGRNSLEARGRGHVRGRLHAQHRNAAGNEMLQKVAVIRRDLDHERIATKRKPLHYGVAIARRMGHPAVRKRGEILVIGKNFAWRHRIVRLDQETLRTDPANQRIFPLGGRLVGPQIAIGERREAEIDEDAIKPRAAEAA